MNICRNVCFCVLLMGAASAVRADEREKKGPAIGDKTFRQISSLLLSDPLNKSARDWSRLIMLYALQTSNAALVFSREELHWVDFGSDNPHTLLLLAAYAAGNIRSQLNSGVKRNDRYSGLLTLFRVYRALRENNATFKIAAVEDLLVLHQENKLMPHLQKLDEKKPAKLTAEQEAEIRKLMKIR